MINKVRAWEAQILRLTFTPRMRPYPTCVAYKIKTSRFVRNSWRKMAVPLLTEKIASKIWTTVTWAVYDGDVSIMLALRSIFGEENDHFWEEKPLLVEYGVGPLQRSKVEAQSWVPQQRSTVGHTDGEMDWRGKRLDKAYGTTKPRKEDIIRSLLESMKQARDLPPLELGIPEAGKWPTLEIKGNCKTIVDWVDGHAKMKTRVSTV